jgi:uncharacterized protein YndB with AHSA1/START domain
MTPSGRSRPRTPVARWPVAGGLPVEWRALREVTVSTVISAPREQIFDFVCDLAGRPAYTDHFMRDYRLARVNPVGVGAASRFQLRAPFAKDYAELQITKVDRPRRIVEEVRVGRRGRNRSLAVYDFTAEGPSVTRVALERLRMIFEEPPRGELKRATIAGFDPDKAPRFGVHAGMDPARAPGREAS